ncbi:MAG: CHAT domain-containing protein [Pseudonocardiaceae bacterium]
MSPSRASISLATVSATGDRAAEALRLVQVAPTQSLRLAREAVRAARDERDPAAEAVAERALGLAWTYVGDLDEAIPHLRSSVALGRRARVAVLVAEARMSLAFVLCRRGQFGRALREAEASLVDVDGVVRARALVQRAVVHYFLGRSDEALAGYRRALPALRQAGDVEWIQRTLANRAIVHILRHAYPSAEADLQAAARLCDAAGLALSAGIVAENLAFLHVRRGDVPAALHYLDDAERRYRALGGQLGSLLTDRSELLLSVGLPYEARIAAEEAVAELTRDHRQVALAEARLLLARAAALDGDPERALDQAGRAVRAFDRQKRSAWAALARLQLLMARLHGNGLTSVRPSDAAAVADALDAAGWSAAAVEARLLAGRLALGRGNLAVARDHLRTVRKYRRRGTVTMRAHAWHGEALLRLAEGNPRGAVSAVTAGLRILDEHQASLGASDLRASVAGRRTELTRLALRVALRDGRADQVLRWAEQGRAQRLLHTINPPEDPVLARYLAELRATVADIEQAHRAGHRAGKLLQRQAGLERSIRDHCRQRPGESEPSSRRAGAEVFSTGALSTALGRAALIEFLEIDEVLHAVTLVDGDLRLHRLGHVVQARSRANALSLALHRLVSAGSEARNGAGWVGLRRCAEELDKLLLRPLTDRIGDRALVLVPTAAVASAPWSTLPSCAGRPVTLAPSATLWCAAQLPVAGSAVVGGTVPGGPIAGSPGGGPMLAAAGPDLPGAQAEVETIAGIYGTASISLSGVEATVEAVGAALRGASVAHLAMHGQIRGDNPLFSSLRLADGPLTVYDLERLEAVPHTVVLAACDAGRSVMRAGDEPLGLSAAFLALGTRQLVAPVVAIPDGAAVELMTGFHHLLASGVRAPEALAQVQQQWAVGPPSARAAAAAFVCMGAGLAVPARGQNPALAARPQDTPCPISPATRDTRPVPTGQVR